MTPRLATKQRRALYECALERARADGKECPQCNLCGLAIRPGQLWDASHDPEIPRWLVSSPASRIAHRRCNRIWNNQHDTPLYAKTKRQGDKFRDIKRSSNPLPGGRDDPCKRTLRGEVINRATGERW